MVHFGGQQGVERSGLDRDEQSQRRLGGTDVVLRSGRREQAPGASSGFGSQQRGVLEECGRRGQAATRLRSVGRELELLGDSLVGLARSLGPVPGVAVGVNVWIGDFRKGAVHLLSLLKRRPPVGR